MSEPTIKTEDNVVLTAGDRAFNYYDMKLGTIGPSSTWRNMPDTWFDFIHDDGSRTTLNGQRICSIEFAVKTAKFIKSIS